MTMESVDFETQTSKQALNIFRCHILTALFCVPTDYKNVKEENMNFLVSVIIFFFISIHCTLNQHSLPIQSIDTSYRKPVVQLSHTQISIPSLTLFLLHLICCYTNNFQECIFKPLKRCKPDHVN